MYPDPFAEALKCRASPLGHPSPTDDIQFSCSQVVRVRGERKASNLTPFLVKQRIASYKIKGDRLTAVNVVAGSRVHAYETRARD